MDGAWGPKQGMMEFRAVYYINLLREKRTEVAPTLGMLMNSATKSAWGKQGEPRALVRVK